MKTLVLQIDPENPEKTRDSISQAAAILRRGGTVAMPTETVYGLAANALDVEAVGRIFAAKQRPSWDPLIVHIDSEAMLHEVAESISAESQTLSQAFWPGPLTLLLPRSSKVPLEVTAGREKVGVRMPAHPVALELIRASGLPLAAPSANSFSKPSPTSAAHVLEDLDGRIDAILDAGETPHGVESTVVDASTMPAVVYRPGVIGLEQIQALTGAATLYRPPSSSATPQSLPSPGVGIRHYAPKAQVVLLDGTPIQQSEQISTQIDRHAGRKIALMLPEGLQVSVPLHVLVYGWGHAGHPEQQAQKLFRGLRELDAAGAEVILCPLPGAEGIGAAVRDRLEKAARTR